MIDYSYTFNLLLLHVSPKNRETHGQCGFTLLEITVAIAIFAVIVSLIYPAYTGTYRNIQIAESKADIYGMARTALIRIIEDLESAYIPQQTENIQDDTGIETLTGEDKYIEDRQADKIRFFSRSHIDVSGYNYEEGDAKIAYYPLMKEDKSISLYRSDTQGNLAWPEENTSGWKICEGLYSVNITYRDKNGDTYDAWDESVVDSEKKLPSIITVTLEFIDSDNPEKPLIFSTSVALPLAN